MARVAHRHVLTAAEAAALRPRSPAARLGPVGWFFAVIALLWLGNELRPLLEWGAFDRLNWGDDATLIVRTFGDAALLALPAGLLLGFPAARRRNPWLFRGVVLLALSQVVGPALRAVQTWPFEGSLWDPSAEGIDPIGIAISLLTVAAALVSLAAVWAISDGLADAGARPRRVVVWLAAIAGIGAELTFIVPYVLSNDVDLLGTMGLSLVRTAISLMVIGLWYVVATRLLVGAASGLVPRHAWAMGGIAGGLVLVQQLMGKAYGLGLLGSPGDVFEAFGIAMSVASAGVWVLLFVALVLGLGRGTNRPAGERRRIPRYELVRPADAEAGAAT